MHMRKLKKLRFDDDTGTLKIDGENGFGKSKTIYLDIENAEIFLNAIKSAFQKEGQRIDLDAHGLVFMKDVHFDEVAFQANALGHRRTISTVSEAAEELVNHWPLTEGERLSAAKKSCVLAFAGDLSGTCVRLAFIDACKEAGVCILASKGTKSAMRYRR